MTPASGTETHYFGGMARNFDVASAGVIGRITAQQSAAFDEELQQRSLAENPDMRLRNVSIDVSGTHARRIVGRLGAAL